MADNNQQYMWRQRKKRNTRLGIWILLVILASAAGTFIYEGIRDGDPKRTAERYFMDTVGVDGYTVESGDRSLNKESQFVCDYTFHYTADGKQVDKTISLTQSTGKKYGLFEQWQPQSAAERAIELDLIAPAGSQVLVGGYAPDASSVAEDETLSPGAVRYHLTGVDPDAKLQVNGLPFESYEGTVQTSGSVLDVRDMLSVSENAKVQMTELGKSMINELYTAALAGEEASRLGQDFANVPNKENLYRGIVNKLYKDGNLLADSISFSGFEAQFGEIEYPGKDDEGYVGIEMTLSYMFSYEAAETQESEPQTEEPQTEEPQSEEPQTESEPKKAAEVKKEAKFTFHYQNGTCTAVAIEVPGDLA